MQDKRAGRIADALAISALCLIVLAAALLVYESFFFTGGIDPNHYAAQHMLRYGDNELTNLLTLLLLVVLLRLINRVRITRPFLRVLTVISFTLAALFAALWTLSAKAIPCSDQGILIESAEKIIAGDLAVFSDPTSYLYGYYIRYPFQFGFLGYTEMLLRLFGHDGLLIAGPLLNVAWLFFGYVAVLKTTDRLFCDNNVTCLTMLLLTACTQLLFACTFYYGTIPCMALSLWVLYFGTDFLVRGRKRDIFLSAFAAMIAVTMKSNAWIYVLALAIVLLLRAIRSRQWRPVLAAVLIVAAAIPGPVLMQKHYESRHGVLYGDGYPLSAWMSMSMQESSMAYGWYNSYMTHLVWKYGLDTEAAGEEAREHIRLHLQEFIADPAYARAFYEEKFWSQWTEPTYMSVWISKTCETYGETGALAKAVYRDDTGQAILVVQNQYTQALFAGFLLYALTLFAAKRDEALLYPIAMLGAVLFHLLFEANAKYALAYLPMFAPMAAYGLLFFGSGAWKHLAQQVQNLWRV